MITACECGSKNFYGSTSCEVNMELEDSGVLRMTTEEPLEFDGVVICSKCGKNYTPSDFLEIV